MQLGQGCIRASLHSTRLRRGSQLSGLCWYTVAAGGERARIMLGLFLIFFLAYAFPFDRVLIVC